MPERKNTPLPNLSRLEHWIIQVTKLERRYNQYMQSLSGIRFFGLLVLILLPIYLLLFQTFFFTSRDPQGSWVAMLFEIGITLICLYFIVQAGLSFIPRRRQQIETEHRKTVEQDTQHIHRLMQSILESKDQESTL